MILKKFFYQNLENILPGQKIPNTENIKIDLDIFFEPLNLNGLKEMHKYSVDDRFYQFLEYDTFKTINDTKKYIKKLQKRMAGNGTIKKYIYWFVRRKKDNLLIGTANLADINFERRSAEIGFGVSPDLWGQNYTLQIIEILKHYCFEVLSLNRIFGKTFVNNIGAINIIKSLGMRQEGLAKEFYCKNGLYIDAFLYSTLKKDYFKTDKDKYVSLNKKKNIKINQIIQIARSALNNKKINERSSMKNTSNWDSLSHVSIISKISKQIGIKFLSKEVVQATSIKRIYKILRKKFVNE
jgi:ribosomal-protein-alanine N-acetyltransferase